MNKFPNSVLLTGGYGVGKTTTARIIAKSLNCLKGISVEPCNSCENCLSIDSGSNTDVLEIDAASNTGVDDIRELIEHSQYTPSNSKYRVYIIDETHMLSKSAFNALLKTLEEPKNHVKFVLATTEIKKVPNTIISRCQCFVLSPINSQNILNALEEISLKEKIAIDKEALEYISMSAKGSMRDALSLLEQSFIYSDNKTIHINLIKDMLGIVDPESIISIINAILNNEAQLALNILNDIYSKGGDVILTLEEMLKLIHKQMMEKIHSNSKEVQKLTYLWQAMINGYKEVKISPDYFIASEMLIIRLCLLTDKLPSIQDLIHSFSTKKSYNDDNNLTDDDKKEYNDGLGLIESKVFESFPGSKIIRSINKD